jgi:hypothetical protein
MMEADPASLNRTKKKENSTVCVQGGQPKTESRPTASLTAIPHKIYIYITDDMLNFVLEMTSAFHACLISKDLKH